MPEKVRTIDPAVEAMFPVCEGNKIETVWDRLAAQKTQCTFGDKGLCCRYCALGPCRVNPEGKGAQTGACGSNADTIAARHFVRMIAAGTAAHSDHGRTVVETFIAAAKGKAPGFQIRDEMKLLRLALEMGIPVADRSVNEIALDVGERALAEFGSQTGPLMMLRRAPLKRQKIWADLGIAPRGIDREVVECMHRTSVGVDQDPLSLILQGSRTALADGWGGSMLATELQDILFGSPVPRLAKVNLGTLQPDMVNIVLHGHEPVLSEIIVAVASEPEMVEYARSKGAKGINLAGICCTANEVLMRHGVSIAGNYLHQEMAIATGAVEAMVVDVQCLYSSLPRVAAAFHTKIITTNPKARIPGATHMEFHEHDALECGRAIVRAAIDNFPNRVKERVQIPQHFTEMVVGFTYETVSYLLGGTFRASLRPLNDNIINGRIRGVAGIVGCNNPKRTQDYHHVELAKHLIKNNVAVLTSGCSAIALGKAGLLLPEAAATHAGSGLAEVCETVGIPPVLHVGSCVDNSRMLVAASAMVKEGGLGDDLSDLPVAGAAPEWMSEKAVAIGQYFVASGVFVVFGGSFPTLGAAGTTDLLFRKIRELTGGYWAVEDDPIRMAEPMIAHIDERRRALGLDKVRERVLFDMEMRRQLEV